MIFLFQDMLVLLDLLGASDPTFYNYFGNTEKWYSILANIEEKLAAMRKFESYTYGKPQQSYFQPYSFQPDIEDDHIPFLRKSELCIILTYENLCVFNLNSFFRCAHFTFNTSPVSDLLA